MSTILFNEAIIIVIDALKKAGYNGIVMLELHKKACGTPQLYEDTDDMEYLKQAYARAQKLSEMIS